MTNIKETLQEKPILGGILIVVLYNVFLLLALFTQSFIYMGFGEMHYSMIMWLQFSLMFGFLALLLLYIVPYGLNLPNGVQNFSEYTEEIQLKGKSSVKNNLILAGIAAGIFILFEIFAGVFMREITFDFSLLFSLPQADSLGAFGWIYSLRPGIWEEIAFRGVVLTMLLKKYSEKHAIIIDGLLFGLIHFMNILFGAGLLETLTQFAYATILGFFLAYMYIKTESLVSCIITHYLIDVFGLVFIISGLDMIMYFILLVGVLVSIPVIINSYIVKKITEEYY